MDLQTGVLYREDNLTQLAQFPDECVDLVYLDPPFFSNRVYEVIWGDEAEVRSFEDRWSGGIQNYIEWMRERVVELHRVLRPTGSLYLHCDPHASHYLKVMVDGVFGMANFRSEVIWKRTSAHSDSKQGGHRYGAIHDVILSYGDPNSSTWNPYYTPYSDEHLTTQYRHVAPDGRHYMEGDCTAAKPGGDTKYEWRVKRSSPWERWEADLDDEYLKPKPGHLYLGVTPYGRRYWAYSQENMREFARAGLLVHRRTGAPRLMLFADEMPGLGPQDLWTDIPPISARAAERLGWPTQKPEALLERIIATSSNPGDVVLDPFCGCGTTVAVAEKLKRRWIGIDISPTAMEIMRRRLLKLGCQPAIENAPDSLPALKQLRPFEFQNWVVNAVNGTQSPRKVGDMGIDGFWFLTNEPIQVKQSEHVGRNVVDNFETALRRVKESAGYIIAFSFTKGAVEEVARAKQDGLNIRLLKVAEILLHFKGAMDYSKKLGPQPASIEELPLPPVRKASEKPTAEELIESDRRAVG